MNQTLTDRQAEVLACIKALTARSGWSPTIREIQAELKLASPFGVQRHIQALVEKGAQDEPAQWLSFNRKISVSHISEYYRRAQMDTIALAMFFNHLQRFSLFSGVVAATRLLRARSSARMCPQPRRASSFEAHEPHRPAATRPSRTDEPLRQIRASVPGLVEQARTALSYRRPDLRIWASLTTVGQRTRKYNASEVQTLPLAECCSDTHPDKQRGFNPVRRDQGRVPLAHPSDPRKCERHHSPRRFGLLKHTHPQAGVSCAHTVSTNQND